MSITVDRMLINNTKFRGTTKIGYYLTVNSINVCDYTKLLNPYFLIQL